MRPDAFVPAKVAALCAAERRHRLFDFRVDGWSPWRVVRNPVHAVATELPLNSAGAGTVTRALRAMWHSLVLLRILLFAGRRELLVKTYRSALRTRQGDLFRDVYVDGLLIRRPSSLKLEVVNSEAFSEQARHALRPADLDASVFTFWGRVLAIVHPRVEAAAFCDRAAEIARQEADVDVSPRFLLRLVSSAYWQARLYGLLLARIRPSVVIVADTGDHALRIACGRRGVRFIELQHGVFDCAHADAVPDWVEGSDDELLLPDRLACYGPFWIEQLAGTRLVHRAACAVGNELIDSARQQPRQPAEAGEVRLLVTSQGVDSGRLAEWLVAMMAAAPGELAWRLTVKLHPAYDEHSSALRRLEGPRVRVVPGSALPNVWDLLACNDLHLSISSAAHFDAAALGVPSIVIPLASHERVLHAVDDASIFLAREPADVWTLARAPRAIDPAVCQRFAVPGFVDNLVGLIDVPAARPFAQGRYA